MSTQKILCDVKVGGGATIYYGTLVVTNIRYEDGSRVSINEYLGVKFNHPPVIANSLKVDPTISPWQQTGLKVVSSEAITPTTTSSTAQVTFTAPYTFNTSDVLSWEINGDLTGDSSPYTGSFELFADSLPSGTLEIKAAAAPDPALEGVDQIIYLDSTKITAKPGTTTSTDVVAGTFTAKAAELATKDETVVATATVTPTQVSVKTGETSSIEVSYGPAAKYAALDIKLGELPSSISKETLHVRVIGGGTTLAEFFSPGNSTKALRRLPPSGTADITAEITVNNVKYSAAKSVTLENKLITAAIASGDVQTQDIDTTSFVELPIIVTTRDVVKAGATLPIRLASTSASQALVYTQSVDIAGGTSKFPVPVAPGDYTVSVKGFLDNSTVYGAIAPTSITVASGKSLQIETRRGANLLVKGFPSYLSFGGLSDLVDRSGADFVAAKATSLFKYAGDDGAGDPGQYLADDWSTVNTIDVANAVQASLASEVPVLPILISYTINLSGGALTEKLAAAEEHAHSFGNLILSLKTANEKASSGGVSRSVPGGWIVNPDFLGECQKANGPPNNVGPDYSMPVRAPLQDALDHHGVSATIPESVNDTLKGYVLAVNWLIRTVSPEAVFGWQVNLWGVGSSTWIYSRDPAAEGPLSAAQKTADWLKLLGVYGGEYSPDFLAVDRYEADDFTGRGYLNSYCYGPWEWARFYDFCSYVSLDLQVPVAPWQVPASRIPSKNEAVADLESEHWGSGGTYLFGDPAIGNDTNNIHETILAIPFGGNLIPHPDVRDLFQSAAPWDLSYPTYADFPLRGIFTVLLGGGITTGIINSVGKTGPWTQEQIKGYMENPIQFGSSS